MSFCTNCGTELSDGAKFCAECGTPTKGTESGEKRKTVYDGTKHKCPHCGELLGSFVTNCPSCGFEIRNAEATNTVKTLSEQLLAIDSKRDTSKIHSIISQVFAGESDIDRQKIDLIKNFPIPNTKEDILEFIIMSASNIDINCYGFSGTQYPNNLHKSLSDAWLAKFEQAYQKAIIVFYGTPEHAMVSELYNNKVKTINKKKRSLVFGILGIVGGILLLFGVIGLMCALSYIYGW